MFAFLKKLIRKRVYTYQVRTGGKTFLTFVKAYSEKQADDRLLGYVLAKFSGAQVMASLIDIHTEGEFQA